MAVLHILSPAIPTEREQDLRMHVLVELVRSLICPSSPWEDLQLQDWLGIKKKTMTFFVRNQRSEEWFIVSFLPFEHWSKLCSLLTCGDLFCSLFIHLFHFLPTGNSGRFYFEGSGMRQSCVSCLRPSCYNLCTDSCHRSFGTLLLYHAYNKLLSVLLCPNDHRMRAKQVKCVMAAVHELLSASACIIWRCKRGFWNRKIAIRVTRVVYKR